jgi:hypothetical protein
MNITFLSFVEEFAKIANLSRLAFGPAPKIVEKTVASHLAKKPNAGKLPAGWESLQKLFRDANKRRLGKKWRPGMTSHQAAIAAVPKVKVADAGSLAAAVGGALAGGAAGDRVIRATKGKLALPIALSSSLGGSMIAGDLYRKHKRRKARKKGYPSVRRAPGAYTASGRVLAKPSKRVVDYDDYKYEMQRRKDLY